MEGSSVLGVQDISLSNGMEEYSWQFRIDALSDDLSAWNNDKNISIGIINTGQLGIDILNANAQKIAMYGNAYGLIDDYQGQAKIKAYSISLDGRTKTWIESGNTSEGCYKLENGFKQNDTLRMIVNFKYRYVVFIKNNKFLYIYNNCKMKTITTFNMYCTITGLENDFEMSLIHFQAKKYTSTSAPLCNRITAAFDESRDKILLKKQAKLSRFDHYDEMQEQEIWKDAAKGTLFIYLDTISNYVRMVFCDESDDVILLQYMHEVYGVTKGVDFVDFNGYDYVKCVKIEEDKIRHVREWLTNKVEKPEYIGSVIYEHGWNDLSLIVSAFKDGLLDDLATKMGIDDGDEQAFKHHIQQLLDTNQFNCIAKKIYNAIGDSWKVQFVGDNSEQCVEEFVKLSKTCFIAKLYN